MSPIRSPFIRRAALHSTGSNTALESIPTENKTLPLFDYQTSGSESDADGGSPDSEHYYSNASEAGAVDIRDFADEVQPSLRSRATQAKLRGSSVSPTDSLPDPLSKSDSSIPSLREGSIRSLSPFEESWDIDGDTKPYRNGDIEEGLTGPPNSQAKPTNCDHPLRNRSLERSSSRLNLLETFADAPSSPFEHDSPLCGRGAHTRYQSAASLPPVQEEEESDDDDLLDTHSYVGTVKDIVQGFQQVSVRRPSPGTSNSDFSVKKIGWNEPLADGAGETTSPRSPSILFDDDGDDDIEVHEGYGSHCIHRRHGYNLAAKQIDKLFVFSPKSVPVDDCEDTQSTPSDIYPPTPIPPNDRKDTQSSHSVTHENIESAHMDSNQLSKLLEVHSTASEHTARSQLYSDNDSPEGGDEQTEGAVVDDISKGYPRSEPAAVSKTGHFADHNEDLPSDTWRSKIFGPASIILRSTLDWARDRWSKLSRGLSSVRYRPNDQYRSTRSDRISRITNDNECSSNALPTDDYVYRSGRILPTGASSVPVRGYAQNESKSSKVRKRSFLGGLRLKL